MTGTAQSPRGAARPDPLVAYRDDGPLARDLGAALGGAVRLPAPALAVAGAAPLAVAVAVAGAGASPVAAGAVVAWLVVLGGVSSGRPHDGRLAWTVAPVVRGAEYAGLLWIAAIAGPSALSAAFALLCALAFRHYDLIYRLGGQGVMPPAWLGALAGGWELRLVAAWALLVAGALRPVLLAAALVLGAVFAAESARSWVRFARERPGGAAPADRGMEAEGW